MLCILVAACSAVESASPDSHDQTIAGVGVLPGGSPVSEVVEASDAPTVPVSDATTMTTTTTLPAVTIGSMVAGNRLLMIGDSITASAAQRYGGELCKALVPLGWQVEVDAQPSMFIQFGNAVLDKRLSAKWDAAYVFLGTNYGGNQDAYRKQLEKIVKRLAPTPVVLLTVTEFADNRREVNDAILLVSTEYSNVHVLDWGAIAAADAGTILRGDGLHLTDSGRATLAATVAGVMGQAPVQPGDCLPSSFTNDAGGNVNGSDTPPPKKVAGTATTVKPKTSTPVGGTATTTTKPTTKTTVTVTFPGQTTTVPTTPPTSPPPSPGPTSGGP